MSLSTSQVAPGGYRQTYEPATKPRDSARKLLPVELIEVETPKEPVEAGSTQEKIREAQRKLEEIAARANALFERTETHLKFEVGNKTGRIVVKIVDSRTDEILRTIPPDEVTRFANRLDEVRGLLFDIEG